MKARVGTFLKRTCPICKGRGVIKFEITEEAKRTDMQRGLVKQMVRAGFTYRQIQKTFNFPSVSKVHYIINH